MTSKTARAIVKMQYRMKLAAVELAKACLVIFDLYETAMTKKKDLVEALAGLVRRPNLSVG